MKRLILPFLAMVVLFSAVSCSEKFNIAAPYKNITVIYGFLDKADTAHYIRIQKAFLDQNKSALVMAQEPDSSFYAHINVRIERFNFVDTIHWHDTIHLNRVDLNTEGYPKQPGVFFNAPNYAYKFTNTLDVQYIYRIVVTNLTTGQSDSASAPVIEDVNKLINYAEVLDDTQKVRAGLDFSSTFANKYYEIFGIYTAPTNFYFNGQTTPVGVVQVIIRFNWVDSNTITHARSNHFYDYDAGYMPLSNGQFDYQVHNTQLYSALSVGMGVAPANTIRLLDRSDISIYFGTQDFVSYQSAALTQGTGLTGSEIEPVYTNVKGSGALGLFTSRGMRTGKMTITDATVDSLIISPLLQSANLKGTIYH
jgi:hypothetical protein